MNKNPKISVIMPVYNSEIYLQESLESILNQTYENFEFIIVNDGSTDKSLEIIKEYSKLDNRIRIISRENKGLIYSLNEAISISRGELIARMDGDDISMPERFKEQIEYFYNNKIDILGSKIKAFGDIEYSNIKQAEEKFGMQIIETQIEEINLRDDVICHPSIMMKTEKIKQIGMYSYKYPFAEDYELWLRAIKNNLKINNLQKILLKYRMHKSSKSNLSDTINFNNLKDYINIKLDYMEKYNTSKFNNCLIWGASNGGDIAVEILRRRFENINIIGYIDKYKYGKFNGLHIHKPEEIKDLNFSYIFIATQPGKYYAEEYLKGLGYKPIKDFLWIT